MLKHFLFFCIIISLGVYTRAQNQEYVRYLKPVIQKSILNKTFIFNSSKDKEMSTTSYLTYFGKTKKGDKVLFIKETYPAAASRHGYNLLLVIDSTGKKYLYWNIDRPEKMVDGVLFFKHKSKNKIYFFKQ